MTDWQLRVWLQVQAVIAQMEAAKAENKARELSKASRAISYAFIQHQTEKAILFAIEDNLGLRSQWVPKSVITAHSESEKRVTIQSWFLDRADL